MRRLSNSGELTEHDLEQVAGGMEMSSKKEPKSAPTPADSQGASDGSKKKDALAGGSGGGLEAQEGKLAPAGDGKK